MRLFIKPISRDDNAEDQFKIDHNKNELNL